MPTTKAAAKLAGNGGNATAMFSMRFCIYIQIKLV